MVHMLPRIALTLGIAVSLGGCTIYTGNEDYGYYDPYYDAYGTSGYADSYFGWYDDYYYPGVGTIIYDRYGSRHSWDRRHRRYWESRRGLADRRADWGGYHRGDDGIYRDRRRHRRSDSRRDRDRGNGDYGRERGKGGFGSTVIPPRGTARPDRPDRSRRGERSRTQPATTAARPSAPSKRTRPSRPAPVRAQPRQARPTVERRVPTRARVTAPRVRPEKHPE